MYCPECDHNPCRYLPDEARNPEGYRRYMQLQRELECSQQELLELYTHALLLGLDSTELEDESSEED